MRLEGSLETQFTKFKGSSQISNWEMTLGVEEVFCIHGSHITGGRNIALPTGISVSTCCFFAVELASTIVNVRAIAEEERLAALCFGALIQTVTIVHASPHRKGGASRACIAKALLH